MVPSPSKSPKRKMRSSSAFAPVKRCERPRLASAAAAQHRVRQQDAGTDKAGAAGLCVANDPQGGEGS
eukprot:3363272-Pleurochrysis_carterae.AAC.3